MHGARGGAPEGTCNGNYRHGVPEGTRNGNYRHGARSKETIELWKFIKSLC